GLAPRRKQGVDVGRGARTRACALRGWLHALLRSSRNRASLRDSRCQRNWRYRLSLRQELVFRLRVQESRRHRKSFRFDGELHGSIEWVEGMDDFIRFECEKSSPQLLLRRYAC